MWSPILAQESHFLQKEFSTLDHLSLFFQFQSSTSNFKFILFVVGHSGTLNSACVYVWAGVVDERRQKKNSFVRNALPNVRNALPKMCAFVQPQM